MRLLLLLLVTEWVSARALVLTEAIEIVFVSLLASLLPVASLAAEIIEALIT